MSVQDPTLYEQTRDGINTVLENVTGVGKIYKSVRYASDWENWIRLHVTQENLVKVGWFSLASATDTPNGAVGAIDAEQFIHYTERTETWSIEYFYGFKDSDTEPTDYDFQLLTESIEGAFRFLQDLNGIAFQSLPLQRTSSALYMLGNAVMCHRAAFNLTVIHRIENPN